MESNNISLKWQHLHLHYSLLELKTQWLPVILLLPKKRPHFPPFAVKSTFDKYSTSRKQSLVKTERFTAEKGSSHKLGSLKSGSDNSVL